MGIRANNNRKNRLPNSINGPLVLVESLPAVTSVGDPLIFLTAHPTKSCLVNLTVFRDGTALQPREGAWRAGPFAGRPALIAELAPAIQDTLTPLAKKSVEQYLVALRAWWRVFDAVDSASPAIPVVASVADLTDVHRRYALDKGMDRWVFNNFLRLADITRAALGLKRLYWVPPEGKESRKHLPSRWQTDIVRHTLKHRWFAVLRRWAVADALRQRREPLVGQSEQPELYVEQTRLLANYTRFDAIVAKSGHPRPRMELLSDGTSMDVFYARGFSVEDMLLGSYPDGEDIRGALHLCLATTGWNPAVLLNLDANESFLEPHPKDPGRYILRGIKDRAGGTEQVSEGLFKSQGSAAFILTTLMSRTAPLREQLKIDLHGCLGRLEMAASKRQETNALRQEIANLERGIRSPWLYVSKVTASILWLEDDNFAKAREDVTGSYLGSLITQINQRQPKDRQVSRFTATTLRKAHAAYIYRISGGSIFAVMKALNHRNPNTTAEYLNNTLLKEEHRKLFSTFGMALWDEIRTRGRVDPTILAKWSRDGTVTPEQRERLDTYRELLRSRIGVGCKDPLHPPSHIAPAFNPDGKSTCPVHRCTLCFENAVILPESLPGLCKRVAELRYIRASMSVGPFLESSFSEELENTELALLAFDKKEVQQLTEDWEHRIASGDHRVIEFDGAEMI